MPRTLMEVARPFLSDLKMCFRGRQRQLQTLLDHNRLDALVITHLPNIRYLCGFTGSSAVLIITGTRKVFFTDGRYTAQAKAEIDGVRIVIARKSPLLSSAEWLLSHFSPRKRKVTVGIEADHITVSTYASLSRILGSTVKLRHAPRFVEQMRMVKYPQEIALLKNAVGVASSLFDGLVNTIRPGAVENEIAAQLEYTARQAGAEQMSFPTIIASGNRSALPHGRASTARVPAKGFVVCDFGVILAGYCSDMTRTVHVGRPTAEARRAYAAVREAQQAACEIVRPGTSVGMVDGAARKLLQNRRLAKYFTHSTGHGVGLEIHEQPRIAFGQDGVLKPGMVITIEPGVYIPGQWGIRIEDMVLVTETGSEVLTPTTKELITL